MQTLRAQAHLEHGATSFVPLPWAAQPAVSMVANSALHVQGAHSLMATAAAAAQLRQEEAEAKMRDARELQSDCEVGISFQNTDELTFSEYRPVTFSADCFRQHPDPVVETGLRGVIFCIHC